jgi:hypothetical protein
MNSVPSQSPIQLAFQLHRTSGSMTEAHPLTSQEERRAHARYPVKLAVRFLIRSGRLISFSGEGTSINISSTGMLFRSSKHLNGGETVVAAVEWPVSDQTKPLVLLFHGHIVWIRGSQVGMSVSHYGFLSEAVDADNLFQLASPRHLTPTRAALPASAGVRQWRKSVLQWK